MPSSVSRTAAATAKLAGAARDGAHRLTGLAARSARAVYGARHGDEHDHRHDTNGSSLNSAGDVQLPPATRMRGSEPDDVHLDCPTLTADEVTGAVYGARPGDEHDHRHTTNGSSPHRADNVQRLPNAPTNGSAPDDVYLDVPTLRVHEVKFELDDLRARVSLDAAVLKLLTLHVGADVELGRVKLTIRGVEAQAQLRVRLDNVAEILGRVMTTIDRNPQILEHLLADVGTAVKSIGTGTGQALEHVGAGADRAIGEIGRGAGSAVQDVGRGAGSAVQDVGRGAGSAVHDVGSGAASAVQDVAASTGATVEKLGHATASATGELGAAAPIVTQAEREGDAEHHVDRP